MSSISSFSLCVWLSSTLCFSNKPLCFSFFPISDNACDVCWQHKIIRLYFLYSRTLMPHLGYKSRSPGLEEAEWTLTCSLFNPLLVCDNIGFPHPKGKMKKVMLVCAALAAMFVAGKRLWSRVCFCPRNTLQLCYWIRRYIFFKPNSEISLKMLRNSSKNSWTTWFQ